MGLFGLGTLKFALSQEWIDKMSWFFCISYFDNYFDNWMGMVKNEQGLIDHGTLKSGVSQKWIDELSRLIEWFLYVDSDGIISDLITNLLYQSTLYLWYLSAGVFWKRIIIFELFESWTMLIMSLFLALILSIWLKIKPNNFIIEFPKSMIKPPCLWNGSYKISPVHLSTCLSIHLSVTHFSQDLLSGFS